MKHSIGHRLFFAVLLSVIAVAVVGLELVRWRLFDNFSESQSNFESKRLDSLIEVLAAQYRQNHDWSFLPAIPQRSAWLREQLRVQEDRDSPGSATLGYRIGLLDQDKHHLAGAIANPLTVAFASIDRRQQAVIVGGEAVGFLVVASPQNPDDELAVAFLMDQQGNLFVVAIISVLLSAIAAALLAGSFRKPIRQLVAGARRLEKAQFDTRLTIRRNDELGELAETFNHLAARLEDMERSRRQWVADTSHELRTPLSVLRAQLEGLQDGIRAATPENIAIMLRQVESLTKLIDDVYELARADVGQLRYNKFETNVWGLVQDMANSYSEKFRVAGLAVEVGAPPARSIVCCDVERMRQVMANLLENSVRYTATGGRIEIKGAVVGDELRITIDDSAPDVSAHSIVQLGERFFRAESSRNRQLGGAGLGLALCKQILTAHDGRLEFAASKLGGLRAMIVLKLET